MLLANQNSEGLLQNGCCLQMWYTEKQKKKTACFTWMWPFIRRHFLFVDNEKSSPYADAKDQIILN